MPKNKTEKWLANQGGRPRATINKEDFEKLCGLHCTEKEICAWFGVVDKTLVAWCRDNYKDENGEGMTFAQVYEIKKLRGNIALRRKQLQLAEKSATMAIFLGKQMLGQRDYNDVSINANVSTSYENLSDDELRKLICICDEKNNTFSE